MVVIGFHGFGTTPKTSSFCGALQQHYGNNNVRVICPKYNYLTKNPIDDFQKIERTIYNHIKENDRVLFHGISLGGFIARHFAIKYNKPMVLFNPSIMPWNDVNRYVRKLPTLRGLIVNNLFLKRIKKSALACKQFFFNEHIKNQTVVLSRDDDILDWYISYDFFRDHSNMIVHDIGGHTLDTNGTLNTTLAQIDETISYDKENKKGYRSY